MKPIWKAILPVGLFAVASMIYVSAATGSTPRAPARYLQVTHTTVWTHPEPSTKWSAENYDGTSGPVSTPYMTDYNVDYVGLRLYKDNVNSNGNVGGTQAYWTEDVEVEFTVVNPDDTDLSDLKLWDADPLNDQSAQEITASGTVTHGKEYTVTIPSGEPGGMGIYFEFLDYSGTSARHETIFELISVTDLGPDSQTMAVGWNTKQRFVYEPYDSDLVETPTCPATTTNNFVHFGAIQAYTKIPYVDTETLAEGDGTGYANGDNHYKWHTIVLRDEDSDLNCGAEEKYKIGGEPVSFNTNLEITIKQGSASGTTNSTATPEIDFDILGGPEGVIEPEGTSPETWVITIAQGNTSVNFGVGVIRNGTAGSEDEWEELILEIDSVAFASQTTETVPGIGWRDRLRFLIQDEED